MIRWFETFDREQVLRKTSGLKRNDTFFKISDVSKSITALGKINCTG